MTISIGIVDDHELVLDSLRMFFDSEEKFEVTFAVRTTEEAREYVRSCLAKGEALPDILLVDYWLQGENGRALAKWILEQDQAAKVVLLSADPGEHLHAELSLEGLWGYTRKDQGLQILLDAILRVHSGQKVWNSRKAL